MNPDAINQLIDRWVNDPLFRATMRVDPEGAIRATGVTLDAEAWAVIRSIDWSLSEAELQSRLGSAAAAGG